MFKEFLKEYKISKKTIGDLTGLSQPTIKNYVEDPEKFSVENITEICKAAGVEECELINLINYKENE